MKNGLVREGVASAGKYGRGRDKYEGMAASTKSPYAKEYKPGSELEANTQSSEEHVRSEASYRSKRETPPEE